MQSYEKFSNCLRFAYEKCLNTGLLLRYRHFIVLYRCMRRVKRASRHSKARAHSPECHEKDTKKRAQSRKGRENSIKSPSHEFFIVLARDGGIVQSWRGLMQKSGAIAEARQVRRTAGRFKQPLGLRYGCARWGFRTKLAWFGARNSP